MNEQLRKLYVDLNSILDFRLGTLITIDPEFAFSVSTKPEYFLRDEDLFYSTELNKEGAEYGVLDKKSYQVIFESFKEKVIINSLETKINLFVKHLCLTHFKNIIQQGFDAKIEIDVNVFPYLPIEYAKQINLEKTLEVYFGKSFKVNVKEIPYVEITPEHVRENYFGMIWYEYVKWVELHDTAIRTKPLRYTSLYVPRLFFGDKSEEVKKELELAKENGFDVFEQVSVAMNQFLPMQFIPVAFFCANIPENLEKYTKPVRAV